MSTPGVRCPTPRGPLRPPARRTASSGGAPPDGRLDASPLRPRRAATSTRSSNEHDRIEIGRAPARPRLALVGEPRAAVRRSPRTTRATYRRRRIVAVVLALGLVVAVGKVGATLGGSPLVAPERPSTSATVTHLRRAAGRLAVEHRRAHRPRRRPASDRRRARARSRGAPRCGRGRRSSGAASARSRPSAPAPIATAPRYDEGMRCPYCREVDDKVVDSRLTDEGARDPPSAGVPGVRPALHDLRALRRRAAARRQARRHEGAVRPGEGRGRDLPGRGEPAGRRGDDRGGRGRGRGGPPGGRGRGRHRPGRPRDPRAPAGARSRSRTCGSRRSTRASRTSPTSSARSASSRRRPPRSAASA